MTGSLWTPGAGSCSPTCRCPAATHIRRHLELCEMCGTRVIYAEHPGPQDPQERSQWRPRAVYEVESYGVKPSGVHEVSVVTHIPEVCRARRDEMRPTLPPLSVDAVRPRGGDDDGYDFPPLPTRRPADDDL